MKNYIFIGLVFVIVILADVYPAVFSKSEKRKYRTEAEWIDAILKKSGLERRPDMDYKLTLIKDDSRKYWFDFNLEVTKKENLK